MLNLSAKDLPRKSKRKSGIIVSTSASGKAVAAHDAHGKFLMSIAIGPAATRGRLASGETFVVPSNISITPGKPIILPTGHVLRFATNSNGRTYMRMQDGAHSTSFKIPNTTCALERNGSITVFRGRGQRAKPYANTKAPRVIANQSDLNALVAADVDRPGGWTADDDFVGSAVEDSQASARSALGTRRTKSDSCTQTSTSSPFTFYLSTFNTGSFGSSGYYSTGSGQNLFATKRQTNGSRHLSLTKCQWLGIDLLVAIILAGMTLWPLAGGCLTPLGEFTLGASCLLALGVYALSTYAGFRASQAFVDAGCAGT
jgi:hypothetical protein